MESSLQKLTVFGNILNQTAIIIEFAKIARHCSWVSVRYRSYKARHSLSFQRLDRPLRLVPRFLVLQFRDGVRDDAAADRELHPAAADSERADENIGIHAAIEADGAQATAVG